MKKLIPSDPEPVARDPYHTFSSHGINHIQPLPSTVVEVGLVDIRSQLPQDVSITFGAGVLLWASDLMSCVFEPP